MSRHTAFMGCIIGPSRSEAPHNCILMVYMLCAKYGLGQSVDCPAQSMDPQIAQSIYRLTRPQACHTTTSSFVAWVSESANGRTDASFLGICPPSD